MHLPACTRIAHRQRARTDPVSDRAVQPATDRRSPVSTRSLRRPVDYSCATSQTRSTRCSPRDSWSSRASANSSWPLPSGYGANSTITAGR